MTTDVSDRRTRRTQAALRQALLTLVQQRHYDQITVQHIVDQANVGRSTFYAHFANKDALLLDGFKQQLRQLAAQLDLDANGRLRFDTTAFFHHVQGHHDIYRTLMWGSGFRLMIEDGQAALSAQLEARLAQLLAAETNRAAPLPVLAQMLSGVLLVLLKWWLDNKTPYTPEQMDAFLQQLALPGVQQIIG